MRYVRFGGHMSTDKEYVNCSECPYCKPRPERRKKGFWGEGTKYGICGHDGNLVFLEPWKEKKRSGSGYIYHDISGCGMYKKV